ncbi:MAG: hypothetical protein ACP5HM_16070 [Anaerolineae bacterium]
MAQLVSGELALEIRFQEIDEEGWVQYAISFLWQNESLINNQILKRQNAYWANRGRNGTTFKASEFGHDTLIPTLEKVLEIKEPVYWNQ